MLPVMSRTVFDKQRVRRRSYRAGIKHPWDDLRGIRDQYKNLIKSAPQKLHSDSINIKSLDFANSSNERNGFSTIQEARRMFPAQKLRDMAEDHILRQFYLQPSHCFFIQPNIHALDIADQIDSLTRCGPSGETCRPPGVGIIFHHQDNHYHRIRSNQQHRQHDSNTKNWACVSDSSFPISAKIIEKFKRAGALSIGTTSPEQCLEDLTFKEIRNCIRNPHNFNGDTDDIVSGAAGAIAAGIGHVALASDFAGSIRISAALTDTVGLKLRSDMISAMNGTNRVSLASDPNCDGFITRSVEDCAIALDVASDSRFGCHESLLRARRDRCWDGQLLKVGLLADMPAMLPIQDTQIHRTFKTAIDNIKLQFALHSPKVSFIDLHDAWDHICSSSPTANQYFPHGPNQNQKRSVIESISHIFDDHDFLITPTLAMLPWHLVDSGDNEAKVYKRFDSRWNLFTCPFNWSDHAAISIPCGYLGDDRAFPVGMQIVSNHRSRSNYEDHVELLSFASLLEDNLNISSLYRPSFSALRYAFKTES